MRFLSFGEEVGGDVEEFDRGTSTCLKPAFVSFVVSVVDWCLAIDGSTFLLITLVRSPFSTHSSTYWIVPSPSADSCMLALGSVGVVDSGSCSDLHASSSHASLATSLSDGGVGRPLLVVSAAGSLFVSLSFP